MAGEELKRTHLKRAGMHPVTEGFTEMYARHRARPYLPPEKRNPVSCTPEEFRTACAALGIGNAKQLGEVIGTDGQTGGARARLGQRRMKDPEQLTGAELERIRAKYLEVTEPLFFEKLELAPLYEEDGLEVEWEYDTIANACEPLFSGSEDELEEAQAMAREYAHRFLIEATRTLSTTRREVLFTVLTALLAQERDGGNHSAGALLESWASAKGGNRANHEALAELIKGRGAMWLRYEPPTGCVRDVTTGRTAEAIDVSDAFLQEYAGLIGAEYGED